MVVTTTDVSSWDEFPVNSIECVHVLKDRTYNSKPYQVCYKCKCKQSIKKTPITPYYHIHDDDYYPTLVEKPESRYKQPPYKHKDELVYLNGKTVTINDSREYHLNLPNLPVPPKKVLQRDVNYVYIVNPTSFFRDGDHKKHNFLIKPK